MNINPTAPGAVRQHQHPLPNEVWQQIAAHSMNTVQSRYAVDDLNASMQALPGLGSVVAESPMLKRFFLLQKSLSQALYHNPAHLRGLGMPDARTLQNCCSAQGTEGEMHQLLTRIPLDKLTASDQTLLLNKIRYTQDTRQRLINMMLLSRQLPHLAPDLQREVTQTLLHREVQDIEHLSRAFSAQGQQGAGAADKQQRLADFSDRKSFHRNALYELLAHFRHLTSYDQQKLFEQLAPRHLPLELSYDGVAQLASSADRLTTAQRERLFEGTVGNSRQRGALAAGFSHFSRHQQEQLLENMLETHQYADDGGEHLVEVVNGIGQSLPGISSQRLQQLCSLLPHVAPEQYDNMLCALAPIAGQLSAEHNDNLLQAALQHPNRSLQIQALTAIGHNPAQLLAGQQDQLVDRLTDDSRRADAFAPAFQALAEQFPHLSSDNQQKLLNLASASRLSDKNQLALITGLAKGFSRIAPEKGIHLPWDDLRHEATSRFSPARQDEALKGLSQSLNTVYARYLQNFRHE